MKWLIIENHISEIPQLKEAGIIIKSQRIRKPLETVGICFPESELKKVVEILKLEISSEEATDVNELFLLQEKSDSRPIVKIENNESTERTRPILERFSQKYGVKIHFHATHDRPHPIVENDWTHIFPYSAPNMDGSTTKLDRIFGMNIMEDGTNDKVIPTEIVGIPLSDTTGSVYGEICGKAGNNLFIHFDITHSWSDGHEKIFSKIMEEYFSIAAGKNFIEMQKKVEKERKVLEAKRVSESKKKYIEYISHRSRALTSDLENQIERSSEAIKALSKKLTEEVRILEEAKNRLAEIREKTDLERSFAREYDSLKGNPIVKNILAYDEKVEVFTTNLVLEGYDIGEFKIVMHLNGKFGCENLTRKVKDIHHPHVAHSIYEVCFGTSKDEIAKLIKKFQLAAAFFRIWSRLNKYGSENPYLKIENWPLDKKGESA